MYIFVISVILAILSMVGVLLLIKKMERVGLQTAGPEWGEMEAEIAEFDSAVQVVLDYLEPLVPYSELLEKRSLVATAREQLEQEQNRAGELEKRLAGMQASVEEQEQKLSDLKSARVEAENLAESLLEEKAVLETERVALESQLELSEQQIQLLATETALTAEQKAALSNVLETLNSAQEDMAMLSDSYKQASTRFRNLQKQFEELEKEFTKLVEKELRSG